MGIDALFNLSSLLFVAVVVCFVNCGEENYNFDNSLAKFTKKFTNERWWSFQQVVRRARVLNAEKSRRTANHNGYEDTTLEIGNDKGNQDGSTDFAFDSLNRVKREPKIYPRSSVMIWKRKHSEKSLNVRRFRHSPGYKMQQHQQNFSRILVKRSPQSGQDQVENTETVSSVPEVNSEQVQVRGQNQDNSQDQRQIGRSSDQPVTDLGQSSNQSNRTVQDREQITDHTEKSSRVQEQTTSLPLVKNHTTTEQKLNQTSNGIDQNQTHDSDKNPSHILNTSDLHQNQSTNPTDITVQNVNKTVHPTSSIKTHFFPRQRPTINPNITKRVKGNVVNYSVPNRRCSQGQKLYKGKCLQVY